MGKVSNIFLLLFDFVDLDYSTLPFWRGIVARCDKVHTLCFIAHRGDKIEKLCGVMGVEWPYDPDDAYELTTDNFKKILAIHMRFR